MVNPSPSFTSKDECEDSYAGAKVRISSNNFPHPEDWIDDSLEDLNNVKVTVGSAKNKLCEVGKHEMQIMQEILHDGEAGNSFETLADDTFGEESFLFHAFQDSLNLSYQVYCRLVAAVFLSCELNVPVQKLYENDRCDMRGMLPSEDFFGIICYIEDGEGGCDTRDICIMLECAFNNMMKKAFLSKSDSSELLLTLYNEQMYPSTSEPSAGNSIHTAATSAIGIPICITVERLDETTNDAVNRMLTFMFGSRHPSKCNKLMKGITFCSIDTYLTPELVFNSLIPYGADIIGYTTKCFQDRCVFDSNRCIKDKEMLNKTLHLSNDTIIRATSYTTGVDPSFCISTTNVLHALDFKTTSSIQEGRDSKAFPLIAGSPNFFGLIEDLPIRPMTLGKGDVSWQIFRKFGLTAESILNMLHAFAQEVHEQHKLREDFEAIFFSTGRANLLKTKKQKVYWNDIDFASRWIHRVDNGEGEEFEKVRSRLDEKYIRQIAENYQNSSPDRDIKQIRKELKKWAKMKSRYHRKYTWYNCVQLKTRLNTIDPKFIIKTRRKDELIELIVARDIANQKIDQDQNLRHHYIRTCADPLMLELLKTSFTETFRPDAYATKILLLKELFRDFSKNELVEVMAIHQTPLVNSIEDEFGTFIGNADAEFIYRSGEETNVIPVLIDLGGSHASPLSIQEKYIDLYVGGGNLRNIDQIGDKIIQLLHHVVLRNLTSGLLLYCDSKNITHGYFINYNQRLIKSYIKIMREINGRALKPFCCEDADDLPHDKIRSILDNKHMKVTGVSKQSFYKSLFLWRDLRAKRNNEFIHLPLPSCKSVMPYNNSFMHEIKETVNISQTALAGSQPKIFSTDQSQFEVVGKLLQLFGLWLHRQYDVNTDASFNYFRYFRSSVDERLPFNESLHRLIEWLIKQADASNDSFYDEESTATALGSSVDSEDTGLQEYVNFSFDNQNGDAATTESGSLSSISDSGGFDDDESSTTSSGQYECVKKAGSRTSNLMYVNKVRR